LINGSSGGGAVVCAGVSPIFRDCAFIDNEALLGGAVYVTQAQPHFINCTFANNSAYYGAAVLAYNGAQPVFENCLIAFNVSSVPVFCLEGGSASLNCCDVYGNAVGDFTGCLNGQLGINGNISVDPLLCNAAIGDVGLGSDTSPCLPGNNDCAVLIGAMGLECMNPCNCEVWGDVDGSEEINPVDVVYLVNFVYKNLDARVQPDNCPYEAGDLNCDEAVNPVDVVYYVNYVYKNLTTLLCTDPCL